MLKNLTRLQAYFKSELVISLSCNQLLSVSTGSKVYDSNNMGSKEEKSQIVTEGKATVKSSGHVFYNPVQEFNRDLSISVLNTFISEYVAKNNEDCKPFLQPGSKYDGGVTILEALAATGLRSIRYAKEVCGIKQIVANDISRQAVETMKENVRENGVEELVTASEDDAIMLMYQHRNKEQQFDIIDLDPYGCPSRFLDSAIQAVKDGGLLLVTATDMAVLAGNSPETCYSKYGSISLRIKSCHEMALRILLHCIETHANRYGRYIEPILSISADFYIRVFVKVHTSPYKCKFTISKLSMVFHCVGCDSFALQSLGCNRTEGKQAKFKLPTAPPVGPNCAHCSSVHHMGGPIWSAPLHDLQFVKEVLANTPSSLKTFKRIQGILSVISEELLDCPLYYVLDKLTSTVHIENPSMMTLRSALLNAGFRVSYTHTHKTSIKTNAPARVIWDIMRCWEKLHPVSEKRKAENSPGNNILKIQPEKEYSFKLHSDANPESRKEGFLRFQENPQRFWGPGTRATMMIGEEKMEKSKQNQGNRKRDSS